MTGGTARRRPLRSSLCWTSSDPEVKGTRLGIPHEFVAEGLEAGVRHAFESALTDLERLGATLEEVSLPSTEAGLNTYYIIAPAECSSNLARMDGVRFDCTSTGRR